MIKVLKILGLFVLYLILYCIVRYIMEEFFHITNYYISHPSAVLIGAAPCALIYGLYIERKNWYD